MDGRFFTSQFFARDDSLIEDPFLMSSLPQPQLQNNIVSKFFSVQVFCSLKLQAGFPAQKCHFLTQYRYPRIFIHTTKGPNKKHNILVWLWIVQFFFQFYYTLFVITSSHLFWFCLVLFGQGSVAWRAKKKWFTLTNFFVQFSRGRRYLVTVFE